MVSFLKKNISLPFALLLFATGFILSYLWQFRTGNQPATSRASTPEVNCEYNAIRRNGFDFTKPLLYVEQSCESPEMAPMKKALIELIRSKKNTGEITTASVYVREFEHGLWTGIGENEGFHPGSLSKVPLMMVYLEKSEKDPSILDREYTFEPPPPGTLPVQNYISNSIEAGKKYKVRDLLRYAAAFSDNNATWLLYQKLEPQAVERLYYELGMSPMLKDPEDNEYRISARTISVFFRSLYNASLLTPEDSDFALSLLNQSEFKEGFLKALPAGTKLVHKFAEWDNGADYELHESGIIYVKDKGYLITVMTRGKQRETLPGVVGALARKVYDMVAEP